ncbi:MAG: hypothetical protein E6R03_11680 [Hyphomicrobiaceae bacterium]|nr:MAG: hypothetical protein E6R03_11680 [Hyphomicrobiaceae bacterium]
MSEKPKSLAEAQRLANALRAEINALKKQHLEKLNALHRLLAEADKQHLEKLNALHRLLAEADTYVAIGAIGLDIERIEKAERVMYVRGQPSGEDAVRVVNDARADIAEGGKKLMAEYFGLKNYAHWHGQASYHPYNMGPKHGSIFFEIGLRRERRETGEPLNDDEASACLYYLLNLNTILANRQKPLAAA